MDEPAQDDPSDDPIVILDDDEEQAPPEPPPRRRRWIWALAAGSVLLAVLGTLARWPGRRPEAPVAPLVVAAVTPAAPEAAPEPLVDDPPDVNPPPPEPPPTPEPVVLAREEPPPPPPEEPVVSYEAELTSASDAIRDAEPLFRDAAEGIHRDDPRFVSAKLDRAEGLLRKAREEYEALRNKAPDQETLEARLAILEELLGDLEEGRARIRVPLALKEAEALEKQGRWREARDRYASIRDDVPDPKLVDRRLRKLDARLDSLEKSAR